MINIRPIKVMSNVKNVEASGTALYDNQMAPLEYWMFQFVNAIPLEFKLANPYFLLNDYFACNSAATTSTRSITRKRLPPHIFSISS